MNVLKLLGLILLSSTFSIFSSNSDPNGFEVFFQEYEKLYALEKANPASHKSNALLFDGNLEEFLNNAAHYSTIYINECRKNKEKHEQESRAKRSANCSNH